MVNGSDYIFEFDARADGSKIVEAKVGQDQSPYVNYSQSTYYNLGRTNKHFTWEFTMEDPSDLNARVVFNMGTSTAPVYLDNISVRQKIQQWAFNKDGNRIPGTIQCEEYDFGGEGLAYHDDSVKDGDTSYRPEDTVDVEAASDEGGGYNVGWTEDDEWLEYTVNVESGLYDIEYRTASDPGGCVLRAVLDDHYLAEFYVPATGGWQSWISLVQNGIWLNGGQNRVLRLEIVKGNQNLNWIKFTKLNTNAGDKSAIPTTIRLSHNYPNPFNQATTVDYQLTASSHVRIEVVDVLGRHVKILMDGKQPAGDYQIKWNGVDEGGLNQASGIYILSVQAGSIHAQRKVILLR